MGTRSQTNEEAGQNRLQPLEEARDQARRSHRQEARFPPRRHRSAGPGETCPKSGRWAPFLRQRPNLGRDGRVGVGDARVEGLELGDGLVDAQLRDQRHDDQFNLAERRRRHARLAADHALFGDDDAAAKGGGDSLFD